MRRVITLDDKRPTLTIETTYTKVTGPGVQVSVWVVTQTRSPERVFAMIAPHSKLAQGYQLLIDVAPQNLRRDGELISFTRGRQSAAKVGVDGTR